MLSRRQFARHRLREDLSSRRGEDDERPAGCLGCGIEDRVERVAPRLGLHDHAGATAEGSVVDLAVPVVGVVAQVVHAELDETGLAGLAEQRDVERVEEARKDRDDVDTHPESLAALASEIRLRLSRGSGGDIDSPSAYARRSA
jgi:hypothetical protein